jgi:hypothetical protein
MTAKPLIDLRPVHVPTVCSVCNDGRPDPKPAQVCLDHSTCNARDYAEMETLKQQLAGYRSALEMACDYIDLSDAHMAARVRGVATGIKSKP